MDKHVSDYYEALYKLYPDIPKEDVRRMVNFGWRQFLRLAVSNVDMRIEDKDIWCFIGELHHNSLKHFEHYAKVLASKIRILYKKYGVKWNGYYYFALNPTQYTEYLEQTKKKNGRPKKHIKYGFVKMYKIKEECEVSERMKKYIFRIPYMCDLGFTFIKKDLVSDKAELIIERNPLKFEDLMNINKNYTYAKATSC